ncbi:hydroxyethylthiazole kinase [Ruminococcus gauvreauii]|uniref:Hydroxyethylthiazole kinase n=1 Tax=Ruminococcus gauvreauii TaxID=438033 RepID=A0ABY5VFD7_9FIRM|nr:hydroxyethylthiazole kinase [Ruminococcus gauvreauii]UWP58991.1 hydroxyethylthiazole kinase [Ruminococcus gauvreauii]
MSVKQEAAKLNTGMRNTVPLVHNITNYVTVNDCANALLAIGASPIMADDMLEAADITAISSALVINIGTLNQRTIESMILAGKRANELGIPVVFDPVGAGASKLRNETTQRILEQVEISILRGNLSEVSYVAGLSASTKGVDTSEEDSDKDALAVAKTAAEKLSCTVAVTGAVDVVSDGARAVRIFNGHPMLSKITGTGCMASAVTGGYAGMKQDAFTAAAAGVMSMGIAGEIAYEKAGHMGTGSFRVALMDALSMLNEQMIEEMGKIEEAKH